MDLSTTKSAVTDSRQTVQQQIVHVQETFQVDPTISVSSATRSSENPRETIHKILRSTLSFRLDKILILHKIQENYRSKNKIKTFCVHAHTCKKTTIKFFQKEVCYSNQATFHPSGELGRHNRRIWGYENPHNSMLFYL